jgi:predicted MFS family arabinose efflux permease
VDVVADHSYGALFRVPGMKFLLTSTLASRVATQMFSVLIVLYVLDAEHSPRLSGLVVLCSQFPGILASPIAGALLDRKAKAPLMRIDFLVAAISMFAVGALALEHRLPAGLLIAIVLVGSLTQPLSRVGGRALLPLMVPRRLWDRSSAVDSACFVVATVLGPAIAGISVAWIGSRAALLLPAALMLFAAVTLAAVHPPPSGNEGPPGLAGVAGDSLAAIRYVFANKVLRMLAVTMTIFNFSGGVMTVAIPIIVLRQLHGGSRTVGLVFAVLGASGFVAGLLVGRLGTEGREKRLLAVSCMTTAAAFVFLAALSRHVAPVVLGVTIVGLCNGPLTVSMFALRQRATEREWVGRAFAVSMNLNFVGNPIGSAVAGVLLTHSVAPALLAAAGAAFLGGLWPAVLPSRHYTPVALTEA